MMNKNSLVCVYTTTPLCAIGSKTSTTPFLTDDSVLIKGLVLFVSPTSSKRG